MVDLSFATSALTKLPPSLSQSSLSYSSPKPLSSVPSLAELRKHAEAISSSVSDNLSQERAIRENKTVTKDQHKNGTSMSTAWLSWSWSSYLPSGRNTSTGDQNYPQPRSATPPPKYTPHQQPTKTIRTAAATTSRKSNTRTSSTMSGAGGAGLVVQPPGHTYLSPNHRSLHSSVRVRKMEGSSSGAYADPDSKHSYSLQQPEIGDMGHRNPYSNDHSRMRPCHQHPPHYRQSQQQQDARAVDGQGEQETTGWVDCSGRRIDPMVMKQSG
ncbi:hypothetical protein I316_03848 [Kwoniella heveanensis BCC8398]|uniref:Uncharacterized protein n=1 Tax=Kwoniella heveanensis BCC8398 TaxID=1296120 RepID=A0A1B9GTE2_9TREE|nr:hypothetical protein I316_03848 [Kwoniella heveanensis BCC8398]